VKEIAKGLVLEVDWVFRPVVNQLKVAVLLFDLLISADHSQKREFGLFPAEPHPFRPFELLVLRANHPCHVMVEVGR